MRQQIFPGSRLVLKLLLVAMIAVGATLAIQPAPARAHPDAKAYSNNGVPVIYVHGFNSNDAIPYGCDGMPNFGTIKQFFGNHGWSGATYGVGYYNGDGNCDSLLQNEAWRCTGWYAGSEGTTSEDVRHKSCELAWYIWDHFTSAGVAVKLIGHSAGGIIIRQAMNDTPYETAFPPYLTIEDVVTAGTPHQGMAATAAQVYCGGCLEVEQIQADNAMMQNMNSSSVRGGFGRNPQGNTGTDWTTMASANDSVLYLGCAGATDWFGGHLGNANQDSGVNGEYCGFMPGATHLDAYTGPPTYYEHGDYLTDTSTGWDAKVSYSDNNGGNWTDACSTCTYKMTHSIQTMLYAVSYTSW